MCAYLLKPCRGSHGFQCVTDSKLRLDLSSLRGILLDEGFVERVAVDIIMVMVKGDIEFTIYPSGKFLIKPAVVGDEDITEELARNLAAKLIGLISGGDTGLGSPGDHVRTRFTTSRASSSQRM